MSSTSPATGSLATAPSFWRKCTTCKKPIQFGQKYWVCSVSTCNRVRTGLVFCDVRCFDAHVPVMNHRDAGAFESRAPSEKEWSEREWPEKASKEKQEQEIEMERSQKGSGINQAVAQSPNKPPETERKGAVAPSEVPTDEILVVVSKVKAYIRARSGMNTSDAVMEILSDRIRHLADQAIQSAKSHGRKTVLDRDF